MTGMNRDSIYKGGKWISYDGAPLNNGDLVQLKGQLFLYQDQLRRVPTQEDMEFHLWWEHPRTPADDLIREAVDVSPALLLKSTLACLQQIDNEYPASSLPLLEKIRETLQRKGRIDDLLSQWDPPADHGAGLRYQCYATLENIFQSEAAYVYAAVIFNAARVRAWARGHVVVDDSFAEFDEFPEFVDDDAANRICREFSPIVRAHLPLKPVVRARLRNQK